MKLARVGSLPRDDFRIFCQRQAARSEARARIIWRSYVDRVVKLAAFNGVATGDLECEHRGYTFGGSENHRGVIEDSD